MSWRVDTTMDWSTYQNLVLGYGEFVKDYALGYTTRYSMEHSQYVLGHTHRHWMKGEYLNLYSSAKVVNTE